MYLITRIALSRVKWKHKTLMMRIKHPALHKSLQTFIAVVLLACISFSYFAFDTARSAQTITTSDGKIATAIQLYSFNGQVTSA
ncbi:MAG: hypothetical protein KW793_00995, partial [Candidatus Doudnabacteria bacterium]|nr:hypothetical protein [Candidatus Doudnabacteria bacterium]